MVKVAIVGLGFMGRMHLSIFSQFSDVEITALCDTNADALDLKKTSADTNIAVSGQPADVSKAKKYADFSQMLKEGGFDFVDVCLPTHLHKSYTIEALRAGYDVFCEKPMALSVEEADEMIQVSKETEKLLTVGQCLRFWPMYVKIKEIIDSKLYGKVISGEFSRYSSPPRWSKDNWMLDGELSGDAALDMHIHDVDMIVHLFGKPRKVYSHGVKSMSDGFSHISTVYGYPEIAVSSIGNWICSSSFGLVMKAFLVLEKAVVELDSSKDPMFVIIPEQGERIVPELDEKDGYYHELRDFVDHVKNRTKPKVVTPETAKESLNIVLTEIISAEKGEPVHI